MANEAKVKTDFVYLRDNGKMATPVWKKYELILRDKYGEPILDPEGNQVVVIAIPPEDLVLRVVLT